MLSLNYCFQGLKGSQAQVEMLGSVPLGPALKLPGCCLTPGRLDQPPHPDCSVNGRAVRGREDRLWEGAPCRPAGPELEAAWLGAMEEACGGSPGEAGTGPGC